MPVPMHVAVSVINLARLDIISQGVLFSVYMIYGVACTLADIAQTIFTICIAMKIVDGNASSMSVQNDFQ